MLGMRERLEAQQAIQDMIARDVPLAHILNAICAMIERQTPEAISSIVLVDPIHQTLSLVSGGRLPQAYHDIVQNVPIGPEVGACGSAAYLELPVICEDIQADPRWENYKAVALQYGLRACWSFPVLTRNGQLLGTFATYYRTVRKPGQAEQELIACATSLVALAIERRNDRKILSESEQRYRSLFTHHPDVVYSLDLDGFFTSTNLASERASGLTEQDILGKHYSQLVVESDLEKIHAAFNRVKQGEPQHYEVSAFNAKGARIYLSITNLPIIVDGQVVGAYGIAKDISQRKVQEMHLRILQRSVESSINGTVIVDVLQDDMPIIYVNPPFLQISGYSLEEVIGRNCRFLQGPDTAPESVALVRQGIADRCEVHVTLLNYRKDGTSFWNDLFLSPVPNEKGVITHYVGVQHDISEQKLYEDRLAYLATHDPLTRLPNRALLEERLNHIHQKDTQQKGIIAVLFIDLDDFKPINDCLGHAFGDRLLVEVSRRLETLLTVEETLARIGGDEFVMLLPNLEHDGQAVDMAKRILALVAKPYHIDGEEIYLTSSVGIATSHDVLYQPSQLVQHADMAMYGAKKQGRNTYAIYSPDILTVANERVMLRRELDEAIKAGSFTLHYQPLICSADGSIKGFEALIRWAHPSRGYVSPAIFIPVAEQTGQIIRLGHWVLEQACRDIMTLNTSLGQQYSVAVNISPLQFHRKTFLENLRTILDETGFPAHLLDIELTEGVLMDHAKIAIERLNALRLMGISVSIDDFGTGYSSLSYLKNLPISTIKIDRSFVQEITTNPHDAAIAQGIVTMAHHLGLKVVAEGIETKEQYLDLTERGCDLFQGYLFARPMPLESLKAYLHTHQC
ncbi:bifunctional diguanylate cyclase/phosphodiesterase [Phytohalomonas tamaricis]|uniref:bifunctional diguanylate cyclase/phosphodiesterase n=1 Tax=Phytohalomonas tamaricis TaxID=2081032 RepID=UPI000D0BE56C|nr:EAL domain-containing protein [Phytohalomonas tamaricis]